MTKTQKDIELGERLRELIHTRFGSRGRFRLLQEASEIPDWKWKNFFYRRQEAGQDQIDFWVNAYPEDEAWLLSGFRASDEGDYPFNVKAPIKRDDTTISDRLRWVIEEFASPRGELLFSYLASRYRRGITAKDWESVLLKKAEPTLQMVELVCSDRPHFAQWVLLGHAFGQSVDPTDPASVQRWKEKNTHLW